MWILYGSVFVAIAFLAPPPLLAQAQDTLDSTLREESRLRNSDRLPEAEILLRGLLAQQPQQGTPDVNTANLLNRLGIILVDEGHFPVAEACFRQAAAAFETLLGPQHPKLATALANLGDLLVEEGRYREAYGLIRRAIDIAAPVLGDCHPEVATMFSELGHLFYREGEIARALSNARRALACIEERGDTVELGHAHHNLAFLYIDDGQFSLAQEHLDRANAILAKLLPPDHSDLLFTANTHVVLCHKQGRYKEARQSGLALIEQFRKKLGPAHPSLAVLLANVGYSDQKLQMYEEAAECFRQAIAIEERTVNSQDPYLAELLHGYAAVLRKTNRRPEAKRMELQAKAILGNSFNRSHP
jgi:tetratricopeptide (TPR) repeat protein